MSEINPPKLPFTTFLLRLLAGLGGGVVGTILLILIFIVASSVIPSIETLQEGYVSPIFIFILLVMVFLSSTIGNLLSTFLLALTGSYKRKASAIYQVFIVSVIIFLLMAPVYFIARSINIEIVVYAVALHIIISAMISALILEIVSNYRYALVGVYGITFSILLSAGVLFGLSGAIENPTILLFAALPVVWGSIAFMGGIIIMIYGWIARIYDKDFLCTATVYGADYGREVETKEEPRAKDEKGADFLRHN